MLQLFGLACVRYSSIAQMPQSIVTMNVFRRLTKIILALALIAAAPIARAEDFPARPIKIIVQTAVGSSLDVMARLIAEPLSQIWGQQAIIVNQAGAGGLIAARATAASAADGYTLFLAGGSVFVVLPVVQSNLPFDVNEFVPIGFVAEQPYTLLTTNKLGVEFGGRAGRAVQEAAGRIGFRCRHARRLAAPDCRMVPQPERGQPRT